MDDSHGAVTTLAIKNAVQLVLGYAWQWTRVPTKVPNWFGYAAFLVCSAFCWIWLTNTVVDDFRTSWRMALAYSVLGIADMYSAARGTAAIAKDTRIAGGTNSVS